MHRTCSWLQDTPLTIFLIAQVGEILKQDIASLLGLEDQLFIGSLTAEQLAGIVSRRVAVPRAISVASF